jgi:hypothetical protein
VDGGSVRNVRAAGYNMAGANTAQGDSYDGAGVLVTGRTRNVDVGDCRFGGGINGDDEKHEAGPNGLSPNATQWGYIKDANATGEGNTYWRQRLVNAGLPGGSAALGDEDL